MKRCASLPKASPRGTRPADRAQRARGRAVFWAVDARRRRAERLLLRRRSLNVMAGTSYTHLFHGITAREADAFRIGAAGELVDARLARVEREAGAISPQLAHGLVEHFFQRFVTNVRGSGLIPVHEQK